MAAAFAALVSLYNNILVINHPLRPFPFDKEQIESLRKTVYFCICFIKSYDDSHGPRKEAAQALERRIARAAEAAEDVIESHVVDRILGGKRRSRSRFLLDLQKAIQDMDYMMRKAARVNVQSVMEVPCSSSSAPLASNNMVGFDGVLVQLLDMLTGEPSSRRVIPVVGMGGIGKTTLATNAFQHPLTLHYFDIYLWVTISQQYSIQKILAELVSGLRKFTSKSCGTSVDEMQETLYKSLYGRRYLIILDDMWSTEAWDEMQFLFPDNCNGSRVVVTTRQSKVAKHLRHPRVNMSFLDQGSSWDLFCRKAFADKACVCPLELEKVGRKIVEKCKGLPLAIVVVGGHLRKSSMALEYWESVAAHISPILDSREDHEEQCMDILSLSYSYLPARLKPCFLLLGAFPEGQWIRGWDIVNLWICEGLIEPFKDTRMEVVAEDYLLDLYQRNLLTINGFGLNREIVGVKLHDVIREMCLKIAKKEGFLFELDSMQAINRERRVVITSKFPEVNQNHQLKTIDDACIRSLICDGDQLPKGMKLLRTLNKVTASSTRVSIFEQVNLRYLKVDLVNKSCPTVYLPSSLSMLWNLKVLKITASDRSTVIAPYEIWEMLQLRHVEVNTIVLVDPLPEVNSSRNGSVLGNLHTLRKVENLRFGEEVCRRIPNVIELDLAYCDEASLDYCPNNLCYLSKLEYLSCDFVGNSEWRDFALRLTFTSSLKRLCVSGCGIYWEELTTLVGSLPNLEALQLYDNAVTGDVWTPTEGNFTNLKYLAISGCDDLIRLDADSSHFPVLINLVLTRLSKLEELPSGFGEIPTLRRLRLELCSVASTLSAITTLAEQEEQGNEDLHLHVYFQGDEETIEKIRDEARGCTNLSMYFKKVNT